MTESSGRRFALRAASALHHRLYRVSGGRLGGSIRGLPILLLTTRGRSTGRPRTVPLGFLREGEGVVVIGSNGGADRAPSWSLNLEADPQAVIEIGRERRAVTARRAVGEERERLWQAAVARFPGYGRYEQLTSRAIPVVVLEPGAGGSEPHTAASSPARL